MNAIVVQINDFQLFAFVQLARCGQLGNQIPLKVKPLDVEAIVDDDAQILDAVPREWYDCDRVRIRIS